MEIVTRYFWALAIPASLLNFLILSIRARPFLANAPDLEATFRGVMRWFIILMNAPFLVMGWGILFGGVPNAFYYLRPQDLNLYVLAFYFSVFVSCAVLLHWVWLRDGATFLSRLHRVFRVPKSPFLTKLFVFLLVGLGFLAIVAMVCFDLSLEEFKF